jgi:membrane protease YdiL (CAAX protease family)
MPWDFVLILFALGVLVPWRGTVRVRQLLSRPEVYHADRLALYASTIGFQCLAVAVAAWRGYAHGFTAQHLGVAISEPPVTAATALTLSLLLVANQLLSLRRLARLPANRQGFLHHMARKIMPHDSTETLLFVALAVTVALCEEFLYRGFVFAAIQDATADSVLLGGIGSSALFALAHAYQGRRGLATTFVLGLVFAAVRTWTASLAPSIVAHLLADLVAGLAAPRLLKGTPSTTSMDPATAPSSKNSGEAS